MVGREDMQKCDSLQAVDDQNSHNSGGQDRDKIPDKPGNLLFSSK